jgi:hypothetical protein
MEKPPSIWHLQHGDTILGVLALYKVDQPWLLCHFQPTSDFDIIKPLFDREFLLLNSDRIVAWEQAYTAIQDLGLRLEQIEDGTQIETFILHIAGEEAWFRY